MQTFVSFPQPHLAVPFFSSLVVCGASRPKTPAPVVVDFVVAVNPDLTSLASAVKFFAGCF
jgi:hypothetical protein